MRAFLESLIGKKHGVGEVTGLKCVAGSVLLAVIQVALTAFFSPLCPKINGSQKADNTCCYFQRDLELMGVEKSIIFVQSWNSQSNPIDLKSNR
jgi:hypothetical protein